MPILLNKDDEAEREYASDDVPLPMSWPDDEAILEAIGQLSELTRALEQKVDTLKSEEANVLKVMIGAVSASNKALAAKIDALMQKKRKWEFKVKYDNFGDLAGVIAKEL